MRNQELNKIINYKNDDSILFNNIVQ